MPRSRVPTGTVLAIALVATASFDAARADGADQVQRLLDARAAPTGVVFEVVTGDEAALQRALPAIRDHARRLRERFPKLPVAVLTHGSEQFSLLGASRDRYAAVHELVTSLGGTDAIPVQVCGNHASFRGKGRADFPDYVEVVASAPSKLAEYRAAGWVVIVQ